MDLKKLDNASFRFFHINSARTGKLNLYRQMEVVHDRCNLSTAFIDSKVMHANEFVSINSGIFYEFQSMS